MSEPTTNRLTAKLTPDQLKVADAIGERVEFAKDQIVFEEGTIGDAMYIVERGSVAISKRTAQNKDVPLWTVTPGEFFGEMAIVDGGPRSARAICTEPSELRILRAGDLGRLLLLSPHVSFNLMRRITNHLRETDTRLVAQIVYQEKMAMVGQMAGGIIHDFKSPMSVIRLSAEMIESGRNKDRIPKDCQTIQRCIDRMVGMAEELLDFSRGRINLDRKPTAPDTWLNELRELLQPLLQGKQITLQVESKTTDPLPIDGNRMIRAVYNLSSNAIDAMTDNGGSLTLRLTRPDTQFLLEVIDTGPGIPEEIRDRLFDAFVTHGKKNGTGLGTAISKKIIEEHGGSIAFTTATGKGTTFQIHLPATMDSKPVESK